MGVWTALNTVLVLVGACLSLYAKSNERRLQEASFGPFFGGITLLISGAVSFGVEWIFRG